MLLQLPSLLAAKIWDVAWALIPITVGMAAGYTVLALFSSQTCNPASRWWRNPGLATDARFASNSRRTAARDALRPIIVDTFATLTAAEVVARLDEAGIANARMNDMHAVWSHAQLAARDRWTQVDSPAGTIPALLPPAMAEDVTPRMDPIPALGQHTDAILRELGYDADAVARLHAEGAV